MKTRINKIIEDDRLIFILLSIAFGYLMWITPTLGDDIVHTGWLTPKSFVEIWEISCSKFFTWSSRVFVNFVLYYLSGRHKILFTLFMGLSMYILLSAMSALFVRGNRRRGNLIIAGFVMLFPFSELSSAGWIATMATYLSPVAFGMMGLVPIRKWLDHEDVAWYEMIGYCVCLIWGSNIEQMMIVLFAAYSVFIVYSIWKRQVQKSSLLLMLPIIVNIVMFVLSPGNNLRYYGELHWFPSFEMLDFVDRLELGFSTMMQWIVVVNHVLIWFLVFFFLTLIWRRYRNVFLMAVPISILIIIAPTYTGVLDTAEEIIPFVNSFVKQIPMVGLVSESSRFAVGLFAKFMIYGLFFFALLTSFFLLANSWRDAFSIGLLVILGTTTRIAIGLSPTIFASSYRTNAVMAFCLIAAASQAFFSALEQGIISENEEKYLSRAAVIVSILSIANFGSYVVRTL